MRATIIKIGNSQGIRIPKPILQQCGFTNEVELEVYNQELVIRPAKQPRQTWDTAFKAMARYVPGIEVKFSRQSKGKDIV